MKSFQEGTPLHHRPGLAAASVQPLRSRLLSGVEWVRHNFSTRAGGVTAVYGRFGDLNLGLTPPDTSASVEENRLRLRKAIAPPGDPWPIATLRQTHSSTVRVISAPAGMPAGGDAHLTATGSLFLGILTADCVPLLLVDTRLRVIAAIHAGWRGTAARIAEVTVRTMHEVFGSDPRDLLAAIGPSIGPCCYVVGEEVRTAFRDDPDLLHEGRLDLWQANRRQLLAAGVPDDRIETIAHCTACTHEQDGTRRFFSHRAEHGRTGRMMAVIGIVGGPAATIG